MPNHFHLQLRQRKDNGISKFLANLQNSLTHYFNTRSNRVGHLFEGQFKAVRIESEEQLFHIHRYIHLNPYTGFIVKNIDNLLMYQWSSLKEYINNKKNLCETKYILSHFKTRKKYLAFILNQADYQKKLNKIKHLILEKNSFKLSKNTEVL